MASWCEEKLLKLENEEVRIPILKEIMEFLSEMPREEMIRTANSLQLPVVFDCLNDSNSEQVDLACEVLSLCMTNLTLGESTNKYGVFLERALTHPYPAVKIMALNEIKRNVVVNDDVLVDVCKRESLIINIVKCISDADISVGKKASYLVQILGYSSVGIRQITSPEVVKSFYEIMAVNEIVKMRVYEPLIKISVQSETNFKLISSTGLLSQILTELNNNDVLVRLNVLELLAKLGQCKHGYEFLESSNILKKISTMLETDDSISAQLCEPGILKFFGNMAYWKPSEIISKYPNIIQRLFNNIESDDFSVIGVSLDTIGHIGLRNEGKIALDSIGHAMGMAVKSIGTFLSSYPTEIKVRALDCLENLLRVVDYSTQMCIITQKWFNLIDDDPIGYIWKYARNPFSEIRLGGFGVLNALAAQSWAQEFIRNTPGLLEFLLDRNVEAVKECKEAKYWIVELLSASHAFDHLTLRRLKNFVNEGPFYVQTITEVAVEGNE